MPDLSLSPHWQFDTFTVRGLTFDPSTWVITRDESTIGIVDPIHGIIDEPDNHGQDDLSVILWGIGWCHCSLKSDA